MKTEELNKGLNKVQELIDSIEVAMITSMEANGDHRSRPMQTQKLDADGCLWFLTTKTSHKTETLKEFPQVNVSYADKQNQSYLSLTGTASLTDDPEIKKELWNPIAKAWFPKGLEDPDLTILKVQIKDAEYWDSSSSKMVQAFEIAKALITGDTYEEGEHGKVTL
ncbi:pyridoxamine 5'-phosphate oxidase family protein [Arundinibacter roseus]|uniref:Pyridoxamine 5'-phosphate oxidase n=1 Tax=Arundinibacter roseus TaxID=2070510 RepID=A0A4R4KRB8_9BACT|nr:pyridoxamine 5'-phosphate oxidase family protein [Arundinibacter roseus]TDB69209.1 pyridoxamine 5'-phosphate oxidase [Arundinibacter roseus]